nr:uncharacterized protein LOC132434766 [Delphinus delphis]
MVVESTQNHFPASWMLALLANILRRSFASVFSEAVTPEDRRRERVLSPKWSLHTQGRERGPLGPLFYIQNEGGVRGKKRFRERNNFQPTFDPLHYCRHLISHIRGHKAQRTPEQGTLLFRENFKQSSKIIQCGRETGSSDRRLGNGGSGRGRQAHGRASAVESHVWWRMDLLKDCVAATTEKGRKEASPWIFSKQQEEDTREMRTLRLREVKQLVKDGTGRTWQSWDLTLDCEIPKSMLFYNIRGTSTMDP